MATLAGDREVRVRGGFMMRLAAVKAKIPKNEQDQLVGKVAKCERCRASWAFQIHCEQSKGVESGETGVVEGVT